MKNMSVDVSLRDGSVISCLQKHDVALVQLEIESYFSHGLSLKPGDTVFDVGANIGLFSMAAYHRCQHGLHVYAFEPAEAIYRVLRKNLERSAPDIPAKIFSFGLASCNKSIPFTYYPGAPVLSTAYPDAAADLAVVKHAVLNSIVHLKEAPYAVRCLRWLPRRLSSAILHCALWWTLRPKTGICQVRTLSQVVRDHGVERIDVLKVDVEKAEYDVLQGVEDRDWPKIRQIVIDVHDDDNRLTTVITLLRKNGFADIQVEQPPTMNHSNIYTVFATRAAPSESGQSSEAPPELANGYA